MSTGKKLSVTLGSDPEFFLADYGRKLDPKKRSNVTDYVIPAVGLVGGTKYEPLRITSSTSIQEDGVTVELNTLPSKSPEAFLDNVQLSMGEALNFLHTKNSKYDLLANPSHKFTKAELASLQAQTLGCDPDLFAHERGRQRTPPTISQIGDWRFAGGHIHVGYENKDIPGFAMIQLLEAANLYYFRYEPASMPEREQFYGLPGLFREKPYGVEYRTPSNWWTSGSNGSRQFIDRLHRAATWIVNNSIRARSLYDELDFALVQKTVLNKNTIREDMSYADRTFEIFKRYGAING